MELWEVFSAESAPGHLHNKILNAPDLPEVLEPYWFAYGQLTGSRDFSDCVPVSEVLSWCQMFDIQNHDDRAFLLKFTTELNAELCDYKEVVRKREEALNKIKVGT